MSIALVAALSIGEVFTSLVIIFFVLIAEELEGLTVQRGRRSIGSLLNLLPQHALVKIDGQFVEMEISAVRRGDIILVKPGARVVVDGTVITGESFVDESTITGESFPVEKQAASPVYAGTINQSGALEVRAEKVGQDTAFGKIVNAVENAERSKAEVQRIADRIAAYLVLFAFFAAAATFLVTHNVSETISVIIVCGACGVAAGTPLAILGSIGRAAKQGSIVKGGLYLERLADVDTVVFDKTGTLTTGKPHVVAVYPAAGKTVTDVIEAAATAELRSEHPLAKAVLRRAEELQLKLRLPDTFSYVPGRGIRSGADGSYILVGNRALMDEHKVSNVPALNEMRNSEVSEMFVAKDGAFLGRIHVADTLRPEARQAVEALKALGIRTLLLTGDAGPIARSVATQLNIDEVAYQLKPEDKRQRVAALQAQGRITAMIGDGINDAPALTEAAVGVAIGSGTDVALESASVVLIGNDLLRFVDTIKIARRCRRVIWFNFAGTILVDTVGMCLAFAGMLSPLLAALVHVGSELAFILNAARLFPISGEGTKKRVHVHEHDERHDHGDHQTHDHQADDKDGKH
jgi:Cu+-exporting ATPase